MKDALRSRLYQPGLGELQARADRAYERFVSREGA
jgi:hypothetical protein